MSSANNFRRGTSRVHPPAGADLLRHGHLRRGREGQEDQDWGPAESHRRHHGTPHWILHHQWCRDHLLYLQVDFTMENYAMIIESSLGKECPTLSSGWSAPWRSGGLMLCLWRRKSSRITWCRNCTEINSSSIVNLKPCSWYLLKTLLYLCVKENVQQMGMGTFFDL